MLERCARVVLRFRLLVLALWLAVLVAGALASTRLAPLLANSFAVPGTDSERARQILARSLRRSARRGVHRRLPHAACTRRSRCGSGSRARVAAAARVIPTGHVRPARAGGGVVFGDVQTTLDLQHAKAYTDAPSRRRRAASRPHSSRGSRRSSTTSTRCFAADLRRGEALALPARAARPRRSSSGSRSRSLIPFVFAACTIAATLAVVYVARARRLDDHLRHEPRRADRARARDRLLAADRPPLPRGARGSDGRRRRRDRAGRWRPRAAPSSSRASPSRSGSRCCCFVPVPFIRSMGLAGLLIPLVVDRRRADAAAGAALAARRAASGARARRDGRLLGDARPADHAPPPRLVLAAGTAVLVALAAPAPSRCG